MEILVEDFTRGPFTVIMCDNGSSHLKAKSSDGLHGTHFCQCPKYIKKLDLDRNNMRNVGKKFLVDGLFWNDSRGFYTFREDNVLRKADDLPVVSAPEKTADATMHKSSSEIKKHSTKDFGDFDESYSDDVSEYFSYYLTENLRKLLEKKKLKKAMGYFLKFNIDEDSKKPKIPRGDPAVNIEKFNHAMGADTGKTAAPSGDGGGDAAGGGGE